MGALLLSLILPLKAVQSVLNKYTSQSLSGASNVFRFLSFQYLISAVIAAVYFLCTNRSVSLGAVSIFSSLGAAASLALSSVFYILALQQGAMALVSLAAAAGLIVPIIGSIFLFGENLSLFSVLGLLLLGLSVYLQTGYSKQIYNRFSFKTFLLLLGVTLSNGAVVLFQKMYANFLPNPNISFFSVCLFGFGFIFLTVFYIFSNKNQNPIRSLAVMYKFDKKILAVGLGIAVTLFLLNQLCTSATKVLPAAVQCITVDGGSMIIAVLTGALFYKEKITPRNAVSVILSIAALLIINLFG